MALHWHQKVRAWLPPGGHIGNNEDPVQAVVRETREETGLKVEVVSTAPMLDLEYPSQVPSPFIIMVEDIDDPDQGHHQHIDMIYICRPIGPVTSLNQGWLWVSRQQLAQGTPLEREGGAAEPPPDDVRLLADCAFDVVASDGAQSGRLPPTDPSIDTSRGDR